MIRGKLDSSCDKVFSIESKSPWFFEIWRSNYLYSTFRVSDDVKWSSSKSCSFEDLRIVILMLYEERGQNVLQVSKTFFLQILKINIHDAAPSEYGFNYTESIIAFKTLLLRSICFYNPWKTYFLIYYWDFVRCAWSHHRTISDIKDDDFYDGINTSANKMVL